MDGFAVAIWMRDAGDNELEEFAERLMCRLSDRELHMLKKTQRDIEDVRRERRESLNLHRLRVAREREAREEAERPFRLAREYERACAVVFGEVAHCLP